jgi:hypothetical protein
MKKILLLLVFLPAISSAQVGLSIQGDDSTCIAQPSAYSAELTQPSNSYFFRDTAANSSGGNGYFALNTGYEFDDITTTFSYDIWVKPTRTINMKGESSVCAGGVSVPLANSNQNWAIVPSGLGGGNMSVGLTIGTNGVMVGEHSGNILVSRLSYTTPINDWVHVAIVYRPDSIFLYLNGDLVRSRVTHCPSDLKCLAKGLTGYYYGPDFQGNIDEFRLWDIPLTHAQIMDIKDKKLMNQVEGLRYYASFDNGKFERTLGDIGTKEMVVNQVTPEHYLKKSSWDFAAYAGSDLNQLAPFTIEDLNYRWSTGETTEEIMYTPLDTYNYLTVEAYNDRLTVADTLIITGEDCGQVILRDTVVVFDTVYIDNCGQQMGDDIRYIRFESYYSEDNAQVNVYEIESYAEGTNRALNKPAFANSTNGSLPPNAVDGEPFSRWSGNRNDVGPDTEHPHFIVVDMLDVYSIDSLVLNIEGFDHWNQDFSFQVSKDSVSWIEIGSGTDTTGIFTYYLESLQSGYDTIIQTIHDTVTVTVHDTIWVDNYEAGIGEDIQFIRFESYYSEDWDQVNVYEVESYFEGMNVALNKPTFANSTNGAISMYAVDGQPSSRWSGDRNDIGPDSLNPHFLVIDLLDSYKLDSVVLNIEGFDHWNQNFSVLVSNDSASWTEIGFGIDTTGIFTYYPHWSEVVYDTVTTMVFDTIVTEQIEIITVYDTIPVYQSLTVTDTLVIDAVLTAIDPPGNINTILIYPNPARDHVYINTGDYHRMNGYQLKIINQTGSVVFERNIEEPLFEVNLSTWTGTGLYFVHLIDPDRNIIDIRKIVLQ